MFFLMKFVARNVAKCAFHPVVFGYLLFCVGMVNAENSAIELQNGWVLKTGDDAAWSAADFDDSEWQAIQTGVIWEKAGLADYDGFAWYRTRVVIPEAWRNQELTDFLTLFLGKIDDVDVTYFNGEQVGATGGFPPEYRTAYTWDRNYRVPLSLVRWGKSNTIAVRIYDGRGNGGLYEGVPRVKLPAMEDLINVSYVIEETNGIYFAPGSLPVVVKLKNDSKRNIDGELEFTLKSDRLDQEIIIDSQSKTVQIDQSGEVRESIHFSPVDPGFYRIVCTLTPDQGEKSEQSILLGFDPEKIETPLTREKDFDSFWKKRLQDLKKVDPQFKVTHMPDQSTEKVNVYLVEMRSYGDVRIRGWYTVPKTAGPHPAILSVPGYTGSMWPYVNRTHVATLALNPRGHGNSKDDVDPKGAEYMYLGFDPGHPEEYIYAGAYLDCIRAVDFLASQPEIDGSRIGVEGGSQGGGLSFATAALDQRICFTAPDIPWLGDWVGYLEAADWPVENYPKLQARFPGLTFEELNRLLSYFDTMNLADRITCPVLMSVGLQDPVCPPRNAFATYNQVSSQKDYRVYPFAGHNTWYQHSDTKNKWMAKHLGVEEKGL